MTVVRDEFVTTDPELAEDTIRRLYVDQRLSISGRSADFAFGHDVLAVTGRHGVAINRLHHRSGMRLEVDPLDDLLVTNSPRHGVLQVGGNPDFDPVAAGPGGVLMTAPTGRFTADFDNLDFAVTALTAHEVGEHAAARCGIAPGSLRFTGLAPISPVAARRWLATVAHVRDDILGEPEIAAIPMVLAGAFQMLATTLLVTFPNTALDALHDPLHPEAGAVTADAADRAADYVRDHAAAAITPEEVANLIGAPTGDIDATLRRRRNTTLALQLWAARMQGAHRDLAAADPATDTATVADIAARWGFVDPATFTVAYTHTHGGETPDETFRR